MKSLLANMTPTTLAAMAADLYNAITVEHDADDIELNTMEAQAAMVRTVLVNNVGETEAAAMIDAAISQLLANA